VVPPEAFAESTRDERTSLRVVIKGEFGKPLRDVTIRLSPVHSGVQATLATDASGEAIFAALPVTLRYDITATVEKFESIVELDVNPVSEPTLTLEMTSRKDMGTDQPSIPRFSYRDGKPDVRPTPGRREQRLIQQIHGVHGADPVSTLKSVLDAVNTYEAATMTAQQRIGAVERTLASTRERCEYRIEQGAKRHLEFTKAIADVGRVTSTVKLSGRIDTDDYETLPGVEIILRDEQSGAVFRTRTGAKGLFSLPPFPGDQTYVLIVKRSGFYPLTMSSLTFFRTATVQLILRQLPRK
jgi:hypothetical protein